ncbi:methylated-DNA--protein-cysteine methyltransferase [Clostridium tetani]|uniref:Methylated-DNA--protein-cysteine methyltransferase n=1 Tax=Clostridium tetani TaxID=1513 RepID=A0ABC8EBZ3_CLOTA|nr:methylated-DNA--[protein]-cysteine S-methyltransferase [Clostridium tetani]CDI49536.1 methylated-DNA--protein-cysteinemethyltransferase [Clostridium tetani 12124569]KGI41495.1 cysteine methyltransferase [Clostridium tetani]KHO39149.1 cysteine methyltransferase [Clostridium tetani]RXI38179.1 methylated-DNA--[protein]-cysteine S-methyltransferase [Clostridium tetani]RXI51208.1 methylated-DNA--[protein]-cysteine S-methyltransferase [Clostridium tetani]
MNSIYSYQTEIGKIYIVENGTAITHLYFNEYPLLDNFKKNETELIKKAYNQLKEYFLGKRKEFDLPLLPEGTDFQQRVWKALREIPFGETKSYGEIAKNIGNPKAARAVGMANNKNPISIFIPCHRVIGSNGKLVGYGGGLKIKEYLLKIEKKYK